jgi:hypothetical protein
MGEEICLIGMDIIVGWYRELLLGGNDSTDSTGVKNHPFAAYGLYTSSS